MSSAIDRAKAHFREVLAQGMKGPISVPEWDLEVYYKPATTFYQEAKVVELQQQGKTVEALVETLIGRCYDAEGNKIFKAADKTELMRSVDPSIILRIVTSMGSEAENEMLDDALKN